MNIFRESSMKCPKCGFPVLSKHTFCPKCAYPLTNESQQQVQEKQESQRKEWEQQFEIDKKQKQLDFEKQMETQMTEEQRDIRKKEHQQAIADREVQRSREQQQFNSDLKQTERIAEMNVKQQEKKFDFDLEQQELEAGDERKFKRDEHQQAIADREVQRSREQQQFNSDLKQTERIAEMNIKQQEKKFDFDLEVQKQEKTDEHVLRMEDHDMKMAAHEQDMADREAQRRMEELKLKGGIAMQNMQAMMDAKRAARQDELKHDETMQQSKLDAEERRLQTQKEMTAEQIMAAQIRDMDAEAQTKFAESFSAGKDAAREREVAKEQAQIYEKMMGQMMDMAKTGMQTNAEIANGRIAEERKRGDEYREEMHHAQERLDKTQEQSLKYTAQVSSSDQEHHVSTSKSPSPIPLNTLWLREHGFEGSFNELAGYLHNLGADISQDYDNQGNPIIVVEGLSQSQVMDVLEKSGVKL